MLKFIFSICYIYFLCISCSWSSRSDSEWLVKRNISIQTLPLFQQNIKLSGDVQNWQGDWFFRRAMLQLVDEELRNSKPDLLIIQNSLSKIGNPYDSDRNILLSGALGAYGWYDVGIRELEETREIETLSIALDLPLKIDLKSNSVELWDLGVQGKLAVHHILFNGEKILVFNLNAKKGDPKLIYSRLDLILNEYFSKNKLLCRKRIILSGSFIGVANDSSFRGFLKNQSLIDVSSGRCKAEQFCYTATPENELFFHINGELRPKRTERILVHSSALVHKSYRNFDRPKKFSSQLYKKYNISQMWPSDRSGWFVDVSLPTCRN